MVMTYFFLSWYWFITIWQTTPVELKHFSFLTAWSFQKLRSLTFWAYFQMNGKDCLLGWDRISVSGRLRNPLRQSLIAGLGHGFLGPEEPVGKSIWIPSAEFPLSQFGGTYTVNWQTCFANKWVLIWLCLDLVKLPQSVLLPGKIPWTEEPGGCSLWGRTESDTTDVT